MRERVAAGVRVAVVGGAALAAAASTAASPGERAPDAQTCWFLCPDADPYRPDADPLANCPSGETCSPETPNGLWFAGTPLGDAGFGWRGVQAIAEGGVETITVASDDDATPTSLTFEAASNGPSLIIDGVTPPRVSVRGGVEGSAHLRILEVGTGLLYDRISIRTAPVDAVTAAPSTEYHLLDLDLDDIPVTGIDVWVGAREEVVLQLADANGSRLVDEAMSLARPAAVSRTAWDVITVAPTQPGPLLVSATIGGATRDVTITAVDEVDQIIGVQAWYGGPPVGAVRVDGTASFCFRATNAGALVLGAPYEFGATNQLAIEPPDPDTPNCVRVRGVSEGTALLRVSVGTESVLFPLEVESAAAAPAPRPDTAPTPPHATPGDVAQGALPQSPASAAQN